MEKYKLAAKLFAILEADDDPEQWDSIMGTPTETELPYLIRLKAAIIAAINQCLNKETWG